MNQVPPVGWVVRREREGASVYSNGGCSPDYRGSPKPASLLSSAPATGGGLKVLAKAEKHWLSR